MPNFVMFLRYNTFLKKEEFFREKNRPTQDPNFASIYLESDAISKLKTLKKEGWQMQDCSQFFGANW